MSMTNCPKCYGEMVPGKAIEPYTEANVRYISDRMINTDTMKLIDVLKCQLCGHSTTIHRS